MSKTTKSEYRKCNHCGKRVMADEGNYDHGSFLCDECDEVVGSLEYFFDHRTDSPSPSL